MNEVTQSLWLSQAHVHERMAKPDPEHRDERTKSHANITNMGPGSQDTLSNRCRWIVQVCDTKRKMSSMQNWTTSWRHRTADNTQAAHCKEFWEETEQANTEELMPLYLGSFSTWSGCLPLYGEQWDKRKQVSLTELHVSESQTAESSALRERKDHILYIRTT